MTAAPLVCIVNPTSGHGRARHDGPRAREALAKAGLACEWRETRGPGEAAVLAERAGRDGAGRVVALGGDGTVNEVVTGLMRVPEGRRPALGVVPLGTGNDFASTLGLPGGDVSTSVAALFADTRRRLDVGEVNGRTFANGFGLGFDGQVARSAAALKALRGVSAYLVAALTTLWTWRNFELSVELDGRQMQGPALLAAVALGKRCGGGFHLTPDAEPDDGLFDFCWLGDFGKAEALWNLPKALKGAHVGHPKTTLMRCREVTLRSDRPLVAHLDGNLMDPAGGPEPLVFRIHEQALEVVTRAAS